MQRNTSAASVGGIAGANGNLGEIIDCVNEANLFFDMGNSLGGIVGFMWDGKVESCINKGRIVGISDKYHCNYVGGIVGKASGTGNRYDAEDITEQGIRIISNCTNQGEILGEEGKTGGIVGSIANAESIIENCTYGGTVNGVPGSEENAIGHDMRNE